MRFLDGNKGTNEKQKNGKNVCFRYSLVELYFFTF